VSQGTGCRHKHGKAPTTSRKALDRFKLGVDADGDQRKREVDALRFQVPDLCWPTM
jgi:hypothetical protein